MRINDEVDTTNNPTGKACLDCPEGLTKYGEAAYAIFMEVILEHALEGQFEDGDNQVFYSPKEWKERGEEYGTDSHLIVTYDGGPFSEIINNLNLTDFSEQVQEQLNDLLYDEGMFWEPCTHWYLSVHFI